jgi:hypothetical protein
MRPCETNWQLAVHGGTARIGVDAVGLFFFDFFGGRTVLGIGVGGTPL